MNSIHRIRTSLSATQQQLSAVLGVGQTAISQYENGGCDPSLDVARKLIKFAEQRGVKLTLEAIFAGDEPAAVDALK